jgi:hypothetical protein
MLGKLVNSLGVFSLATLLSLGAFATYLVVAGRVNGQRLDLISAVLRGELDGGPRAGDASATSADSQPSVADVQAAPGSPLVPSPELLRGAQVAPSAEQAQARRRHETLEALRIERAMADLEARRRLLDQILQEVIRSQEALAAREKAFDERSKQYVAEADDQGFKKELEYFEQLKPTQAKEHLSRVWQTSRTDAIRLMLNIDQGRGKRILETFKTTQELQLMTELLEQIRLQGSHLTADTSRKTDGAHSP